APSRHAVTLGHHRGRESRRGWSPELVGGQLVQQVVEVVGFDLADRGVGAGTPGDDLVAGTTHGVFLRLVRFQQPRPYSWREQLTYPLWVGRPDLERFVEYFITGFHRGGVDAVVHHSAHRADHVPEQALRPRRFRGCFFRLEVEIRQRCPKTERDDTLAVLDPVGVAVAVVVEVVTAGPSAIDGRVGPELEGEHREGTSAVFAAYDVCRPQ